MYTRFTLTEYNVSIFQYKLIGRSEFMKKKWLKAGGIILTLSIIDWFISMGFSCTEVRPKRKYVCFRDPSHLYFLSLTLAYFIIYYGFFLI